MSKLLREYRSEDLAALPAGSELDSLVARVLDLYDFSGVSSVSTFAIAALEIYRRHGAVQQWHVASPIMEERGYTVYLDNAHADDTPALQVLIVTGDTLALAASRAIVLHAHRQPRAEET